MTQYPIGPDHPDPGSCYCCPGLAVLKREVQLRQEALDAFTAERDRRITAEFASQSYAQSIAAEAAEEAVTKALLATEKRFDAIELSRQGLAEQAAGFMPRAESEARHADHEKELGRLAERVGRMEGTGIGKNLSWGYIVGAVVVMTGVVTLIIDLILKH